MSPVDMTEPDPSVIGNIPIPPFAKLPNPARLFAIRAARFRALAEGHQLEPYLRLLADLSDAQAAIQEDLPDPEPIDPQQIARAKEHKMPPLDRGGFVPDAAFKETLKRLLEAAGRMNMPPQAQVALARVAAADEAGRAVMLQNVLADAIPVEALAEHVYIAAALQVHFARLAARLDAAALEDVGDGVCPSCGGPPTSSVLVNWPGIQGARYCSCSLCNTWWNYVRSKCCICGSTRQILFQEVAEGDGSIKAETCDDCHGYTKVFNQQKNRALDPVADDVASLGLDLLVRELEFRRGGVNPFLIGY
ncbi:MAG TPA: formate dehydrogenase accessory protein FdhE [Pseudolabrys sp.]|nr:formate dehydrogenase accessory protein FdhE [Pseudolabrys sp.]